MSEATLSPPYILKVTSQTT